MSSAGLPEDATASGGPLWLFSDPYAYQYAEIPQHVRKHESRSPSPARPTPSGSAAVREPERLPPARRETTAAITTTTSAERRDVVGGGYPTAPAPPAPAPVVAPLRRYTAMPPPPPRLETQMVAPAPGQQQQQHHHNHGAPVPKCLQPGQPHVLNYVNHGEIVRSRHANPKLRGRFPGGAGAAQARKMTSEAVPPLTGARYDYVIKRADTVPLPLVPGLTPVTPVVPVIPDFSVVPVQEAKPTPPPQPRPVIPIKPGVSYEPGLMVVVEEIKAATPKKDFDSILSEIRPQTKTSKWRRYSRAIMS